MSSIAKRPDGQYRARYRGPCPPGCKAKSHRESRSLTPHEYTAHRRRRIDAQRWLDERTAEVVTGTWIDPTSARTTLAEYAARWQAGLVGRPNSLRNVDVALRLHVLPVLGSRPLSALRPSDVQGLVKTLSETLAPGTVAQVVKVLRQVCSAAVEDRVIPSSPAAKVRLPRDVRPPMVVPTTEQIYALADAVPGRYRALVILLAGTGMRISEALGLDVADVDFLRRSVSVARQLERDGSHGPTKTSSSVRVVPLAQVVVDELARHLEGRAPGVPDQPLFTTDLGERLRYRPWLHVWDTARHGVGVAIDTHDLRHYCASALIAGGASVKQVQTILGHGSAATTLRVYAHAWPTDDDRTRSVMDAALGRSADSLRTEEVVAT